MILIICAGITVGVCISLYGWGALCHRLANCPIKNRVAAITVGLGAVIFLGGVLNLLRCAYGWTFDCLLLAGIVFAVALGRFRPKLPRDESEWFHLAVLGLIIALVMYFTVKTQLPPKVFNWHDDFEKYFAHPARMLQTGTLFGSPLNALGSETLGGQAVLHGMVLNHFPIQYINGVDAVFGLLLCLLLSVSMFPLQPVFFPIAFLSPLVVLFINPQYVNVSALYIGSAFMMTSILLFAGIGEDEYGEKTANLPSPILTGLIYSSLIALKSIFVLFPLLHLISFIVVLRIFGVDFRRSIRWGLITAGATLLFILPWFLLYLPYYIHTSFAQTAHSAGITPLVPKPVNLLSTTPLYFGASPAHYTFICMAPVMIVLGVVLWRSRERTYALAGLVSGATAVTFAYLLLFLLGPIISGYPTSIRYAIPFLIAGAPVIFSLVYLRAFRDRQLRFKLTFVTVPLLFGILTIISFSSSFADRVNKANKSGSMLAFLSAANDHLPVKYTDEVIHGDTKSRIIKAQEQIPAGQAVVAWINAPFHLDYRRNIIYDAERSGISTPWAYIPDADYFLYEYKGAAVLTLNDYLHPESGRRERYLAEKCIALLQYFGQLKQSADTIYDDGKIVVLKKRKAGS